MLPVDPPPGSGLRQEDLVALATDAAARAWELATGSGDGGLSLDRPAGPVATRTWRNRITRGDLQLRFGRDRLWYRFVRSGGQWTLDGEPSPEPATLVAGDVTR